MNLWNGCSSVLNQHLNVMSETVQFTLVEDVVNASSLGLRDYEVTSYPAE
jgi:hypothetical protein